MHTYRKGDSGVGWLVVFDGEQTGPAFDIEAEAAAFACFLNGGRYCPDEIAPIFAVHQDAEEDTSTHPDRPKSFDDDYPLERKRG